LVFQDYNSKNQNFFMTFSDPVSNFRTFQVLKSENSNFMTFQHRWETCSLVDRQQSLSAAGYMYMTHNSIASYVRLSTPVRVIHAELWSISHLFMYEISLPCAGALLCINQNRNKLEIWSRAQLRAVQHRKSNCKDTLINL